jgi:hypothetical protein
MTPVFNPLPQTSVVPSAGVENPTEPAERRELAHRINDGIEVTLFWSKPTNTITLEVLDSRAGSRLAFGVDRRVALDAFAHPYAYAPTARREDRIDVAD